VSKGSRTREVIRRRRTPSSGCGSISRPTAAERWP
jgi:hypothetical protein